MHGIQYQLTFETLYQLSCRQSQTNIHNCGEFFVFNAFNLIFSYSDSGTRKNVWPKVTSEHHNRHARGETVNILTGRSLHPTGDSLKRSEFHLKILLNLDAILECDDPFGLLDPELK